MMEWKQKTGEDNNQGGNLFQLLGSHNNRYSAGWHMNMQKLLFVPSSRTSPLQLSRGYVIRGFDHQRLIPRIETTVLSTMSWERY